MSPTRFRLDRDRLASARASQVHDGGVFGTKPLVTARIPPSTAGALSSRVIPAAPGFHACPSRFSRTADGPAAESGESRVRRVRKSMRSTRGSAHLPRARPVSFQFGGAAEPGSRLRDGGPSRCCFRWDGVGPTGAVRRTGHRRNDFWRPGRPGAWCPPTSAGAAPPRSALGGIAPARMRSPGRASGSRRRRTQRRQPSALSSPSSRVVSLGKPAVVPPALRSSMPCRGKPRERLSEGRGGSPRSGEPPRMRLCAYQAERPKTDVGAIETAVSDARDPHVARAPGTASPG